MKHGCTLEIVREISTDLSHYNRIKVKLLSRVRLCANPQRASHQAPPSLDSPGRNTGVGCHFLLQCMKVKSESEVAQSCPTFSDLMDCSLQGSSVHGIFQARVLEWSAIALSNKCIKVPEQAPPSIGFSRQEYWSGVPLSYPTNALRYLN